MMIEEVKEHYKKDPFNGSGYIDHALVTIILYKELLTTEEFDTVVRDLYITRAHSIKERNIV